MREKSVGCMWVFMGLEKAYDRLNRETLWRVLSMYDVGSKPLN